MKEYRVYYVCANLTDIKRVDVAAASERMANAEAYKKLVGTGYAPLGLPVTIEVGVKGK